MDVPDQAENEFTFLPPFCFIRALNRLDDAHCIEEGIFFIWSIDSNPNLIQKPSQTHPEIMFLPAIWASFGPISYT